MKHNHLAEAATAVLSLAFLNLSGQFTPGNLVTLQAGDGVNTLTNTGNPIVLKEFSPSGTLTYSLAVPSTGTNALLISGSAVSEGGLNLSPNRKVLSFGGYAAQLPNSTPLPGSTASSVNRAVGSVGPSGIFTLSAVSAAFFSTGNIRSAVTNGIGDYWAGGSVQGTDYFGSSSSPATVQNAKTNTRSTAIFNGQLYFSTASVAGTQTNPGIYAAGSGTPVVSGQTVTNIINTGSGSQPEQFCFESSSSPTLCYIADSRSGAGGGVQKWVYAAGSWSLAYTIPTSTANNGAFGLTVNFSGTVPVVFATSAESTNNRLVAINDAGSSSSATTLASSGSNTSFRGLAFSPCLTPTVTQVAGPSSVCANQTLQLIASSAGSAASYAWYGPGAFSSTTAFNPIVSNPVSGGYTVTAMNACGTSSPVVFNVSVMPLPTLTAICSATAVCPGQSVTLTGSGAANYTWSPAIADGIPFVPAGSAVYTLNGSDGNCTSATTVYIQVNSFSISVNATVICPGQTAQLIAAGAASYTWSSGATGSVAMVTPSSTASYTVQGISSAGCFATQTTSVIVTSSPTVSVLSATLCSGKQATLVATGANNYTWSNGVNGPSITVSPTSSTVYSVTGSLTGCPAQDTKTAQVTVFSTPVLSVTGGTMACNGAPLSLTVTGASTYTWSTGASSAFIAITPSVITVLTVTGTSGGCASSASHTVYPSGFAPTVIAVPATATLCEGESIKLTAGGATSYTWSSGTSGGIANIIADTSTVITVTGAHLSGCTATASVQITVLLCTDVTQRASQAFAISPNPAEGMVTIDAPCFVRGDVIFTTVNGDEAMRLTMHEHNKLDVTALPDGLYIVTIHEPGHPPLHTRFLKIH